MKRKLETLILPPSPILEESVIAEMQKNLMEGCGWLDHIFGKATRLNTEENKRGYYPAILTDNAGEYLSLLPDDALGCFAFFYCTDPQRVEKTPRYSLIHTPFSCVVWGDKRKVSGASLTQIKESVLKALARPVKVGEVEISNVYERAENIYQEYNISEVKTQYLMQPYFGMRVEGELAYYTTCV